MGGEAAVVRTVGELKVIGSKLERAWRSAANLDATNREHKWTYRRIRALGRNGLVF
jgi:hypothetical protein